MPKEPWEKIHLDFKGPLLGGKYLFVVIDCYTRYPEVEIMTSIVEQQVTKKLRKIFASHMSFQMHWKWRTLLQHIERMRDPIKIIINPLTFFPVSPKFSRDICTNKLVHIWKLTYHSTYVDSVKAM